jgi:hypothetical protein
LPAALARFAAEPAADQRASGPRSDDNRSALPEPHLAQDNYGPEGQKPDHPTLKACILKAELSYMAPASN